MRIGARHSFRGKAVFRCDLNASGRSGIVAMARTVQRCYIVRCSQAVTEITRIGSSVHTIFACFLSSFAQSRRQPLRKSRVYDPVLCGFHVIGDAIKRNHQFPGVVYGKCGPRIHVARLAH